MAIIDEFPRLKQGMFQELVKRYTETNAFVKGLLSTLHIGIVERRFDGGHSEFESTTYAVLHLTSLHFALL